MNNIESRELTSESPVDGTTVWSGRTAGTTDIQRAIAAAEDVLPKWSEKKLSEREEVLRQFAEVLKSRTTEIAATISREIGKPSWEARTEVTAMIGKVELSIQAHALRCGSFSNGPSTTRFRPHGLVAVLGPYNFPGHLPNGHLCPALLAGNVAIFKPSEIAPATAELMLQCWDETQLPPCALQILHGGAEVAEALVSSPEVRGVFFTGSARTGKIIARNCADDPGKILALEMGGNNPLIVDLAQISNPSAAAFICAQSAFISAGQRCTCARRLILIGHVNRAEFLSELIRIAAMLRIGAPHSIPEPFMGPLASKQFAEQVMRAWRRLIDLGAIPLLEACHMDPETGFVSPGILDVSGVRSLPDEEIFGPVLQLQSAENLDEAIGLANNTRFGLATGVLTDNEQRYAYALPRLRAGIVNWNHALTGASSAAPFGGIGDSGNHRPSAWFAADYCSFPVASMESGMCKLPQSLPPGISLSINH